jgi:hypothetical protein
LLGRVGELEEFLYVVVQSLGLLLVEAVVFEGDEANALVSIT